MGNCFAGEHSKTNESVQDKAITRQLRRDKVQFTRSVKLLLLGSGGAGKSTIFKQVDILHKDGFSHSRRLAFRDVIRSNVITAIQKLVRIAEEELDHADSLQESYGESVQLIKTVPSIRHLPSEQPNLLSGLVPHILKLWESSQIQEAWKHRARLHVEDSAKRFLGNLEEIAKEDYLPVEDDILHARLCSVGLTESNFAVDNVPFKLYDVGGQRTERRKWIHCFDSVTAVVYVASLSEYDQLCEEDDKTNRMKESLTLFEEAANSKWFRDSAIILFLNKTDLLKEKLQAGVDPSVTFPEYSGGADYNKAVQFIEQQYRKRVRARLGGSQQTKELYVFHTCATDTKMVKNVLNSVTDTLLHESVEEAGLL